MRANVKPFVHWAIYKGYTVRFHSRTPQRVTGRLSMPTGHPLGSAVAFVYEPERRRIVLEPAPADDAPAGAGDSVRQVDGPTTIYINEHGWEIAP